MIATCPPSERLQSYVLGKLPDQESDELYGHLSGCEACQIQLEGSAPLQDSFVAHFCQQGPETAFRQEPAFLAVTDRAKNLPALWERWEGASPAVEQLAASEALPDQIGEYQVDRLLGRGGMGTVYLGHHTKLGRRVALKVISRHRLSDPRTQGRFAAEMKAVGRMNHPNIVVAHDAREIDGLAVLVTEYIEGLNVGSIIRRTGPLSAANAARIASDIANALAAIAEAGLIHRDIKPSNIMISQNGQVKLLDLGLARLQSSEEEQPEFTATGQALGTVDYIAPEQIQDGRNVDIRADLYGLGCTLFKMLTGQPVFDNGRYASAFAKMTAHVQTPPPRASQWIADLPAPLVELVDELLHKDPASRPPTPQAVLERLAPFTAGADLAALVSQAVASSEKQLAATPALAPAADPPSRVSGSFFVTRRSWMIGAGFCGVMLGWLVGWMLGIEITIKHPDGTTTKLNVTPGSIVSLDEHGNATVILPGAQPPLGEKKLGEKENASQALEGIWKFRGQGAQSAALDYMIFRNGRVATVDKDGAKHFEGTYRPAPLVNRWAAEIDIEVTRTGERVHGYYQMSQRLPDNIPLVLIWFSEATNLRPATPEDSEEQLTLELCDLKSFTAAPPTKAGAHAWRIWQELGHQNASPELSTFEQDVRAVSQLPPSEIETVEAPPSQGQQEFATAQELGNQIEGQAIAPSQVPLEGIWKFVNRNRFQGSYFLLAKGRFAIVGGPLEEGELAGTWRYDAETEPPLIDLEFTIGGPPDPQLGVYRITSAENVRYEPNAGTSTFRKVTESGKTMLTISFGPPKGARPPHVDARGDQLKLLRIDLPAGVAEADDLPATLPAEVWRKWKELSKAESESTGGEK